MVLTSSGQDEFKFGRSTPWYWHLVVKMSSNLADLPLDLPPDLPPSVLTSNGQDEFKFGHIYPSVLTSSGQDEFMADLPLDLAWYTLIGTDI